jgi:hypothetical protein
MIIALGVEPGATQRAGRDPLHALEKLPLWETSHERTLRSRVSRSTQITTNEKTIEINQTLSTP